ncbi:MAG: outer membrane lipoprotein carrier protein LolA [Gammaproteobacteria bacterium]|nr:outer membrane lipoprotein carrier protein LolA [Gammaproteobacteria bacterium]
MTALPGKFNSAFMQTRSIPGFKTPLVSYGIVHVDGVHGFRWQVNSPYHYVFLMQGDKAEELQPDGSVRELKAENTPWLEAVQHIFMAAVAGDLSELQNYFHLEITRLASGQQISMTPRTSAMAAAIESIQLIETTPGQPKQLLIREKSGGRIDIRFHPEKRSGT